MEGVILCYYITTTLLLIIRTTATFFSLAPLFSYFYISIPADEPISYSSSPTRPSQAQDVYPVINPKQKKKHQ